LAKKSRKLKLVKSQKSLSLRKRYKNLNPLSRIVSSKHPKKFVFCHSHLRNVNVL
jgi:hypothetical protein